MPALTETSLMIRETQAFQVCVLKLQGKTIQEACDIVGISYDIFRRYMRQDPIAIRVLREFIAESQIDVLVDLELHWVDIVRNLITIATNGTTKPADLVPVAKLLHEWKAQAEKDHHAEPGIEDQADQFLREGPRLKQAPSRMVASLEVTPTPQGGVTVSVSSYGNVLDLKPSDALRDSLADDRGNSPMGVEEPKNPLPAEPE